MSGSSRQTPRSVRTALLAGVVAVVVALWWWRSSDLPGRDAVAPVEPPTAPAGVAESTRAANPSSPGAPRDDDSDEAAPLGPLPETAWAAVDLDAIREVMPDNLFWKMAVPTTDSEILAQRAKERERWNVEYGKVLSATATAEEIDTYYAERQRLAQDYVEFATYLLAEYGDALTVRDVGLLKVAIELNLARLEEFPRQIVDAHARREAHDAARRAWLEQQRAFEETPTR